MRYYVICKAEHEQRWRDKGCIAPGEPRRSRDGSKVLLRATHRVPGCITAETARKRMSGKAWQRRGAE